MEVGELWGLVEWVRINVTEPKLQKKYGQLQSLLAQNAQPNQPKTAFEQPANELKAFLNGMSLGELSQSQSAFLEQLKLSPYIGLAGAKYVEDSLYRNQLDIATAATRMNEAVNNLNQAIDRTNKIREGLTDLVRGKSQPSDSVVLRVTFTNDAAINNVVQLRRWSKDWWEISRGLAMATGQSPDDVLVLSVQNGSINIDLGVGLKLAKLAEFIIDRSLDAILKIYKIRHQAQEVRKLRLENDFREAELETATNNLEAAAEKQRTERVTQIHVEAAAEFGIKEKGDGERYRTLGASVRLMVNFFDKGGHVDVVVPPEQRVDPGSAIELEANRVLLAEVRKQAERIRQLENSVKAIGYTPYDEPGAHSEVDDDNEDDESVKHGKKPR